jgi:hypothetical protein
MKYNFDPQMSLSKSKCLCLHFLKRAVPLFVYSMYSCLVFLLKCLICSVPFVKMIVANLDTPKATAKFELRFKKPASEFSLNAMVESEVGLLNI